MTTGKMMTQETGKAVPPKMVSPKRRFVLPLVLAIAASACSSNEDGDPTFAAHALGVNVFLPDSVSQLVAFAEDLDDDERIVTLDEAIEAGVVFSSPILPGVFFTVEPGAVLQRYRFLDDGRLQTDGRVSFAGLGETDLFLRPAHAPIVSASKAYLLSAAFGDVLVWNPTTLEVVRRIELPEVGPTGGESGQFSLSVVERGTELLATYFYRTADNLPVQRVNLIVIDTMTDTVTVDTTTACAELSYGVARSNGDTVWASGGLTAVHRIDPSLSPPPCLLIVPAGAARFADADEEVISLLDLTGGVYGANLVAAGPDRALFRGYDEDEVPIPEGADPLFVTQQAAWRWWELDLVSFEANPLPNPDFGSAPTLAYAVRGETYVVRVAADLATSTLQAVPPSGPPIDGLTVTGILQNGVVALR